MADRRVIGTIAWHVYRGLRREIVTMRLMPGEQLSEQEVAARLGVSRSPVREAFIKLSEVGLLRVMPQRSTVVVKISRSRVEDVRFIREAVETAIVREASESRGVSIAAALRDNLRSQSEVAAADDPETFIELDDAFHRLLSQGAGRPLVWETIEAVKPQMDRVRFLSMADTTPMEELVAQHTEIANAVLAGDSEAAADAMASHLREMLHFLPAMEQRFPELFETNAPEAYVSATAGRR